MESYQFPSKETRSELRANGVFPFSQVVNSAFVLFAAILFFIFTKDKLLSIIFKISENKDFNDIVLVAELFKQILSDTFKYLLGFVSISIIVRIIISLFQSKFYFKVGVFKNYAKRSARGSVVSLNFVSALLSLGFAVLLGYFLISSVLNSFGFYKPEFKDLEQIAQSNKTLVTENLMKSSKELRDSSLNTSLFSIDLAKFSAVFITAFLSLAVFTLVTSFITTRLKFMMENNEPVNSSGTEDPDSALRIWPSS